MTRVGTPLADLKATQWIGPEMDTFEKIGENAREMRAVVFKMEWRPCEPGSVLEPDASCALSSSPD